MNILWSYEKFLKYTVDVQDVVKVFFTWAEVEACGVAFNLTDGRAGSAAICFWVAVKVLPALPLHSAVLVRHVSTENVV